MFGGVAEVAECSPSKYKDQVQSPEPSKKDKNLFLTFYIIKNIYRL
jgi:hypothetical protein